MQIENLRKYLLVLFVFTLPNSVAINNIALGLLIIFWVIWGDKKQTLETIKNNPVALFAYILFFSFAFSLLWSQNISWGLHIIKKEYSFLAIPLLMTMIKKDEYHFFIKIFIFSMTLSEIISYSVKFGVIPPSFHANVEDPAPFMGHISYNPFLAFTIYLLIYYLINKKESKFIQIISVIFITTMTVNLFITGGRAGQVMFFILMTIAILQFFKFNLKSVLLILTILPAIFIIAYKSSDIFNKRVNLAFSEILNFQKNPHNSIGKRITFNINTFKMIKSNPIIGAGVGDFPNDYKKINKKYTSDMVNTVQPHNMYLFVWASGGIISFLSLLFLLFSQIILGFKSKDDLKYPRTAFPIAFSAIMFSDSYLLGHYVLMLFVFLSAIFYKGFTWRDLRKS